MESVERALNVIRQAEANLREIVSKAATGGDYAGVVQVASWASALGNLGKDMPSGEETDKKSSPKAIISSLAFTGRASKKPAPPPVKSTRSAKMEYPRFFRQSNQLVRVAWSKKEKKEYQHKAPQAVLKALAEAMAKTGAEGRIMSTDQFLPINHGDGTDIPSYQAYVALALFKQAELIDQHGRQGYSIPRLVQFKDDVESLWQKLPAH